MKRLGSLVFAVLVGAGLALSGCSSDSGSGGSGGRWRRSGGDQAKGKIGVILPDTKSSVRWESKDRPALEEAFKAAGVPYTIQNAEGSADNMATIADGMIADGVTVLAIVNLDSDSGAAIQQKAASQGVKTIDYDRLTLGGVGRCLHLVRQHQGRRSFRARVWSTAWPGKPANVVFLNGSPTDNNATLFTTGAHSAVDKTPSITVVGEQSVPDWDNDKAVTIFEQMYTAADGKIDGVYAANDGLAGSVISILEKNQRAGQVPVTGQDATVEGLQNILAGTQCMTVYKSAKEEAGALAKAAIALAKGERRQHGQHLARRQGQPGRSLGAADPEGDHQGQRRRRHHRRRPVQGRGVRRPVRGDVHRGGALIDR